MFPDVSRCFHKSVLKRAKGVSCVTHYEQFHGCFISPRFTGPTKGELCRQLGVVILVDDQLQNILDAVSHGLFDDLLETILVTLTVGSVGMCMLSFRTKIYIKHIKLQPKQVFKLTYLRDRFPPLTSRCPMCGAWSSRALRTLALWASKWL